MLHCWEKDRSISSESSLQEHRWSDAIATSQKERKRTFEWMEMSSICNRWIVEFTLRTDRRATMIASSVPWIDWISTLSNQLQWESVSNTTYPISIAPRLLRTVVFRLFGVMVGATDLCIHSRNDPLNLPRHQRVVVLHVCCTSHDTFIWFLR